MRWPGSSADPSAASSRYADAVVRALTASASEGGRPDARSLSKERDALLSADDDPVVLLARSCGCPDDEVESFALCVGVERAIERQRVIEGIVRDGIGFVRVGMLEQLRSVDAEPPDRAAWKSTISGWKEQFPLTYEQSDSGFPLKPQYVLERLRDNTPDDTIVVAGVGQHQMWASQFWQFDHPYTWVNSGGLGTMGFAVPGAIGAKVGHPDKMVWAVDGDGCFQMTAQELITAAAEKIPVKVAILNNAYLGMVRQWQELFYDERYSEVYLSPDHPDYVGWAEAMGCVGIRVESAEEVLPAIEKANAINDKPVVVDFRVDSFEKVYPMVPAGGSNDDIILGPEGDADAKAKGTAPS